jgi:hypothetical protein
MLSHTDDGGVTLGSGHLRVTIYPRQGMRIGSAKADDVELLAHGGAQLLWSNQLLGSPRYTWHGRAKDSPPESAAVQATLRFPRDTSSSATVPTSGTLSVLIVVEGPVLRVQSKVSGIGAIPAAFGWEICLRGPSPFAARWTLDTPWGRPISPGVEAADGASQRIPAWNRRRHLPLPRDLDARLGELRRGDRFNLFGPDRTVTVRFVAGYPQAHLDGWPRGGAVFITPELAATASLPGRGAPGRVVSATWELTRRA